MQLPFQDVREPEQNAAMFEITRRAMVQAAIQERLILDEDLAMIPEVIPRLVKLAGEVRDDLYHHHSAIREQIQLPVVQNCFCYCFAKGAESAFLWNQSADGNIEFSYLPSDAIEGRAGARVSNEFSALITMGMTGASNVFCGFQNGILMNPHLNLQAGGRWLADFFACGLYWSASIGLDFGMNRLGFA